MRNESEERKLDNQISDFTNRLLDSKAGEIPELAPPDDELGRQQRLVIQLHRAGKIAPPGEAFLARVKANLLAEYRRLPTVAQHPPSASWWQRVRALLNARPSRGLTLRLAVVTLVVLLLALFLAPPFNPQVTGAAGISTISWITWIGLLVTGLIVAMVFWFTRRGGK